MDEYIKKAELISMIQALPVAELNGISVCSKHRVLAAIEVLPTTTHKTKMRRNQFSQVYCQSCSKIISLPCWEVEHLGNCPHCGLEIEECIF